MEDISIKQALFDLFSISDQLIHLKMEAQEYWELIDFIKSKDFYSDDNVRYPTLKEVEKLTGLKTYQLRKQIKGLYSLMIEQEGLLNFDKIEYNLHIRIFKKHHYLKLKHLASIPRIGERFEIRFIKAKLDFTVFYVSDISQRLESNKQIVDIFLKAGFNNKYIDLRKDKAEALGEIPFIHRLEDWELQDKLRNRELDTNL